MAYPEKHIALICNPTRENEKALLVANSIMLLLKGMDVRHTLFVDPWPRTWDGITEAWVIGGDGTTNWFINEHPNFHLPLAVFAGGSGNDFHWMLYGDKGVEAQVELVLQATPKKVDAGMCNDRLFLNGVGIGFDGAIVKDLLGKKKLAGKASYLLSVMKNIIGYQEKYCTLEMPQENISQECMMISVANARRYGGGFQVAPQASLTDELLDINIVGKISPFNRMRYLPVIEKGAHLELSFVKYRQVPDIQITSKEKMHAHVDGEYFYDALFRIEILPKRFSLLY